jgi:hypothetical protein
VQTFLVGSFVHGLLGPGGIVRIRSGTVTPGSWAEPRTVTRAETLIRYRRITPSGSSRSKMRVFSARAEMDGRGVAVSLHHRRPGASCRQENARARTDEGSHQAPASSPPVRHLTLYVPMVQRVRSHGRSARQTWASSAPSRSTRTKRLAFLGPFPTSPGIVGREPTTLRSTA